MPPVIPPKYLAYLIETKDIPTKIAALFKAAFLVLNPSSLGLHPGLPAGCPSGEKLTLTGHQNELDMELHRSKYSLYNTALLVVGGGKSEDFFEGVGEVIRVGEAKLQRDLMDTGAWV